MSFLREFLGDGVYAEVNEDGQIVLTTEDGIGGPTNTIYLEPEVANALDLYLDQAGQFIGNMRARKT